MKNVEVVLPYLASSKSQWYVEYRCVNPSTGLMQRFRIYKGFKDLPELESRKLAEKIIKKYSDKLQSGWRPWDGEKYIYQDLIEYNIKDRFLSKKKDNNHLHKLLSEFLTDIKQRLSAKSFQSYNSKTRLFCQYIEQLYPGRNIRPYDITNADIIKFFTYLINERNIDRITINKYRQNLNMMFQYFLKKKLIKEIPMQDLPRGMKKVDKASRPMMDIDMVKFLEYSSVNEPQMFLASIFQFFLLCRPGNELRLMKIEDIDFFNQVVYIRPETGKTGARRIAMPDALLEVCKNYNVAGHPANYFVFGKKGIPGPIPHGRNFFSYKFREIREKLFLSKLYTFYSWKHTGAGKLLESNATIAELMNQMGHKSLESTMRYIYRHFGPKSEKVMNFNPEVLRKFI